MKWLGKFKKRRHDEEQGDDSDADPSEGAAVVSPASTSNAGSKPLLKDWFQARAARTAVPLGSKKLKTTERLQVSKAGVTTLINRTYIVIKHIGSGTYGQVKLAFNVRDKKLYAIKACRKSQLGVLHAPRGLCKSGPALSGRAFGIPRHRRSMPQLARSSAQPPATEAHPLQPAQLTLSADTKRKANDLMESDDDAGSSISLPQIAVPKSLEPIQAMNLGKFVATPVDQPISEHSVHDPANVSREGQPSITLDRPSTSGQFPRPLACSSGNHSGGLSKLKAEEFVREIAIMKKLAHQNIVKLVEVIDDPASDNLLLVMEYVEGRSLQPKKIGMMRWETVDEIEAWQRARDVVQGLDYLHLHGVVHGDLKPANLMQDSSTRRVKIVDFGSAVLSSNMVNADRNGAFGDSRGTGPMSCTPAFRSPESLQSGYRPSTEMDMWALGVTIFMWVFGCLPFSGTASFIIYDAIKSKELTLPLTPRISEELKDFIALLLDKNATTRLNVVDACRHPWITGNGMTPLPQAPLERTPSTPAPTPMFPGPESVRCGGRISSSMHDPRNSCPVGGFGTEFFAAWQPSKVCSESMLVFGSQQVVESPPGPHPDSQQPPRVGSLETNYANCQAAISFCQQASAPNSPMPKFSSEGVARPPDGEISGSIGLVGGSGSSLEPSPLQKPSDFPPCFTCRSGEPRRSMDQGRIRRGGTPSFNSPPLAGHLGSLVDAVTPEEMERAISKTVGGSAIAELMGMVLEEVSLPAHTVFISAGDPVDKMYLIAQGEVELYQDLVANQLDHLQPIISGVHAEDVDMDEDDEDDHPKGFLDSIPPADIGAHLGVEDSEPNLYSMVPTLMDSAMHVSSLVRTGQRNAPRSLVSQPPAMPVTGLVAGGSSIGGAAVARERSNAGPALATPDWTYPSDAFGPRPSLSNPNPISLSASAGGIPASTGGHDVGAILEPRSVSDVEQSTSQSVSSTQRTGDTGGSASSGLQPVPIAGGSRGSRELPYVDQATNQIVLALKGPGDSLGLPSLQPQSNGKSSPVWQAHVRTVSDVVVFKADVASIHRLVRLYPELEQAMKSIVTQQQTDLKVAEALRELRLQAASSQSQLTHSASVSSKELFPQSRPSSSSTW